jgi:hypothetical protein
VAGATNGARVAAGATNGARVAACWEQTGRRARDDPIDEPAVDDISDEDDFA